MPLVVINSRHGRFNLSIRATLIYNFIKTGIVPKKFEKKILIKSVHCNSHESSHGCGGSGGGNSIKEGSQDGASSDLLFGDIPAVKTQSELMSEISDTDLNYFDDYTDEQLHEDMDDYIRTFHHFPDKEYRDKVYEIIGHYEDIPRHYPTLVKIVKKLGQSASGTFCSLEIIDIDEDLYQISEYDGAESVRTPKTEKWIDASIM